MKKVLILAFCSFLTTSCDKIVNKISPDDGNCLITMEHAITKSATLHEIANLYDKDNDNIDMTYGYRVDNNNSKIYYIEVEIKEDSMSFHNDTTAVKMSNDLRRLFHRQIRNLTDFQQIDIKHFSESNIMETMVRKEKMITVTIDK